MLPETGDRLLMSLMTRNMENDVKAIDIRSMALDDGSSTDIRILKGEECDIRGGSCEFSLKDGTLLIMVEESLEMKLPENLALESISVSVSNGLVNIAGFSGLRRLKATSPEGSIIFQESGADEILVDTATGEIILEDIEAKRIRTGTVSGRTTIIGMAEHIDVSSMSGAMILEVCGKSSIMLKTTSGNQSVTVSGDAEVDFSSVSGSGKYLSTAGAPIRISSDTISGQLTVNTASSEE